jgi:prolyl-tRNA synthetase
MVDKPRNLTLKSENFSQWYLEILQNADLVDERYNIKGFSIIRPWLMDIIDKIYVVWEAELRKTEHSKILFPTLIPEENFEKEKEHVEGFTPEVFWITHGGETKFERRLALRPTSETAFYSMFPLWIRSYEDLPLKLFQSCPAFRYETKATKPLIRMREFLWIEAHDAFADEIGATNQVKEDIEITKKVHKCLNIPSLFFKRPEWDKFKGAVSTFASDTILPDNKRLQIATNHNLGQNFSKPFEIKFTDKDEREKFVYQTCYGPGIVRTAATIISLNSDDFGLILPFSIAPIQIVIIPILKKDHEQEILDYCQKIEGKLKGYTVKIDDKSEGVGSKFYKWEIKGVPVRIEIGLKEVQENSATLFRRDKREKSSVKIEEIIGRVKEIETDMETTLSLRAKSYFKDKISEADSIEDLKKKVEKGFVKVPFCSRDLEGKGCAEALKEIAEIAGTIYPEEESALSGVKPASKKCIVCGKPADVFVYCCRSY